MTVQFDNRIHSSAKLTHIAAFKKLCKRIVFSDLRDRIQKLKQRFQKEDLVRTAAPRKYSRKVVARIAVITYKQELQLYTSEFLHIESIKNQKDTSKTF